MSTNRGTWRRPSRSSSTLAAAIAVAALAGGSAASRSNNQAGLVFTRVKGEKYSVWVAHADGSHAHRIVVDGEYGTLSRDGRWLAYNRLGGNPRSSALYVLPVVGGRPRRLGDVSYAWSRRGARLALSDATAVRLLDVASGKRRTLVKGRRLFVASFAPDGRALVYTRRTVRGPDADLRSDIFIVRLSDTRVRRLTHDGRSGEPVWGRGWIAYRHYRRTKWPQIGGLWFMRPDGSDKHLFSPGDENPRLAHYGLGAVRFSNDGKRLLACIVREFGCAPVTIVA